MPTPTRIRKRFLGRRPRQVLPGYNSPIQGRAGILAGLFRTVRNKPVAPRSGPGTFRPGARIDPNTIEDRRPRVRAANDAPRSRPLSPKAAPKRKRSVRKPQPYRQKFHGQDRRRGGYMPIRPQLENGQNRAAPPKKRTTTRRKALSRR